MKILLISIIGIILVLFTDGMTFFIFKKRRIRFLTFVFTKAILIIGLLAYCIGYFQLSTIYIIIIGFVLVIIIVISIFIILWLLD